MLLSLSKPHPVLPSHCYSAYSTTTSHFPRHLRRATHEWTRVTPFDGALPTTVSTLTTAILPYSTRRAPPPLYSRPRLSALPLTDNKAGCLADVHKNDFAEAVERGQANFEDGTPLLKHTGGLPGDVSVL